MASNLIRWGGLAGLIGGVLWSLFPLGIALDEKYFPLVIIPLLLMMIGLVGLHTLHQRSYGRLGQWSFLLSFAGFGVTLVGLGIEAWVGESEVGHLLWLIGLLVLLIGSVLLGIAIRRADVMPLSRLGGLLLIIALPIGIPIAIVLGAIFAGDLGFWFGLMSPYGFAWALVGYALRSSGIRASAVQSSSLVR